MAEIVERLTGRTLDDLAKSYVFSPLAMKDTMYRPAKKLWPQIGPTEIDNNLRHRLVQGECTTKMRLPSAAFRGMRDFLARRRIWQRSARWC